MRIFKNFWAPVQSSPELSFSTYVHLHSLALISAHRCANQAEADFFASEHNIYVGVGDYVVRTVGEYAVLDTRTFMESYATVTAELMNSLFTPDCAII